MSIPDIPNGETPALLGNRATWSNGLDLDWSSALTTSQVGWHVFDGNKTAGWVSAANTYSATDGTPVAGWSYNGVPGQSLSMAMPVAANITSMYITIHESTTASDGWHTA